MLETLDGDGFCTGFSIDNKRDYFMTASHCVNSDWAMEGFMVDGVFPETLFDSGSDNDDLDIAVLYVEGLDRPELRPRTKLIKVGMEVGMFGFALEDGIYSHFRAGNVSSIGTTEDLEGLWIMVDQPGIGGMSGGPVVDTDGRLVTVVQRSDRTKHNLGRDIGAIYRATEKYWRK